MNDSINAKSRFNTTCLNGYIALVAISVSRDFLCKHSMYSSDSDNDVTTLSIVVTYELNDVFNNRSSHAIPLFMCLLLIKIFIKRTSFYGS